MRRRLREEGQLLLRLHTMEDRFAQNSNQRGLLHPKTHPKTKNLAPAIAHIQHATLHVGPVFWSDEGAFAARQHMQLIYDKLN